MKEYKKEFGSGTLSLEMVAEHNETRRLLAEARRDNYRAKIGAKSVLGLAAVAAVFLSLGYVDPASIAGLSGVGMGLITIKKKLQSMVKRDAVEKKRTALRSASAPTPTP